MAIADLSVTSRDELACSSPAARLQLACGSVDSRPIGGGAIGDSAMSSQCWCGQLDP
jgi:hypothetical protein